MGLESMNFAVGPELRAKLVSHSDPAFPIDERETALPAHSTARGLNVLVHSQSSFSYSFTHNLDLISRSKISCILPF